MLEQDDFFNIFQFIDFFLSILQSGFLTEFGRFRNSRSAAYAPYPLLAGPSAFVVLYSYFCTLITRKIKEVFTGWTILHFVLSHTRAFNRSGLATEDWFIMPVLLLYPVFPIEVVKFKHEMELK